MWQSCQLSFQPKFGCHTVCLFLFFLSYSCLLICWLQNVTSIFHHVIFIVVVCLHLMPYPKLYVSVNWFLCHMEMQQIPLFLVMDYIEQNSGVRKWSKTYCYHLSVADWGKGMGLNSRKSYLDQLGMWMDVMILVLFCVEMKVEAGSARLFLWLGYLWLPVHMWHRDTAIDCLLMCKEYMKHLCSPPCLLVPPELSFDINCLAQMEQQLKCQWKFSLLVKS